jgi:long-chain fatty acid transport protein
MKFSPAIALQPSNQWSFGLALQIDYSTLDLRNGSSPGYALGAKLGTIYRPTTEISLGFSYVTSQKVNHKNVISAPPISADLEVEAPQEVGFGAAWERNGLLLEANAKWLNWSDADGYEDFDWDDQWVFALGAQYYATEKLALRIGYNFGENPVKDNDGWDGGFTGPVPNDVVNVQGTIFPRYYYETFRIIGFPAIVEQHFTFGIGYDYSPKFSLHLGFVYAPSETIKETGTAPNGLPVTIESELGETSIDFGFTWRF